MKTTATDPAPPARTTTSDAGTGVGREGRRRASWLVYAARLGTVVLVLALWDLGVRAGMLDPFFVGRPAGLWESFVDLVGTEDLWINFWATAVATVLGFLVGSGVGILVGLGLGTSRFWDRVFSPLLAVANSLPRIALAPLFILWFGLSLTSKVWMGASLSVFIMLYNARSGVLAADRDHLVVARMLDMNRRERFLKVIIPGALPAILAGLRLSLIFSLLGVIASEMIAARDGLGQLAVQASSTFQVNRLFAILLIIALFAAAMNSLLDLVERRAIRWRTDGYHVGS